MLHLHFNDANQTVDRAGRLARSRLPAPTATQQGPHLRRRHHRRRQDLHDRRLQPARLHLRPGRHLPVDVRADPDRRRQPQRRGRTRRPTGSTSSMRSTPTSTCSAGTAATSARSAARAAVPASSPAVAARSTSTTTATCGSATSAASRSRSTAAHRHAAAARTPPGPQATRRHARPAAGRRDRRHQRRRVGGRRLGPAVPAVQLDRRQPRRLGRARTRWRVRHELPAPHRDPARDGDDAEADLGGQRAWTPPPGLQRPDDGRPGRRRTCVRSARSAATTPTTATSAGPVTSSSHPSGRHAGRDHHRPDGLERQGAQRARRSPRST